MPVSAPLRRLRPLALALAISLLPALGHAHHTYVTKYDANKLTTLAGTISNVRYQNPHIFFDLATGNSTVTIETESIPVAQANGLTESLLKDGAKATITGWVAREGAGEIGLKSINIGGKTITMRKTAR